MVTLARPLLATVFVDLAQRRVRPQARQWLDEALGAVAARDAARLTAALAAAARHLGRGALALDVDERSLLRSLGVSWSIDAWQLDELARVALLLHAAAAFEPASLEALIERVWERGDMRERQAIARALPLLPSPERWTPIALDACRSSVRPVLEAIACDNPYPAARFHEIHFNQMVLKCLVADLPLERVVGLGRRLTPELSRLGALYAAERRAAGRSVHPDLWRLTGELWSAA